MATGMVLSVAQTLFAALNCNELREVCSMFGYESQLLELQSSVNTIKAVLLDVDLKHGELTNEGQVWVENLKGAVYDVEDLVDEFRTTAQRMQHDANNSKKPHYPFLSCYCQPQWDQVDDSKKVQRFFSRCNKLFVAFNTSKEIKKLRERLNSITKNHSDFGMGDVFKPVAKREESSSFVLEEIIGRETDKEVIVGVLLGSSESQVDDQRNDYKGVSFVSVVGFGGLGKTALAQFVFNDDRIKTAFDLRLWVCVSENFSMEDILRKMLERDGLCMETLLTKVSRKIKGKKYLLVLDDVWNENLNDWDRLRGVLDIGDRGSKVLVTSRSKRVAKVVKSSLVHELQGLSEVNAWCLFKRKAFEQQEDAELVEIGKDIVKRCANVPLAIKMVGGLLYGQEKWKWIKFRSMDLSAMGQGTEGDIMPILKFSYHQLTKPGLKSCFSYCALFPEDHVFTKEELIYLWLAHGCLHGEDDGMSLEDVGEEYFSILLQRCFFQDVEKDGYGEISSCKMHDLIHDLAKQVAGQDIYLVNKRPASNKKIRHLAYLNLGDDDINALSGSCTRKVEELRTLVIYRGGMIQYSEVAKIIASCRRLRVLRLRNVKTIPNKLIESSHLRFLDLYMIGLEMLPTSITDLINLQVMILGGCKSLKELPKELRKLVNLRHLDISGCHRLTHMPSGMHDLINLHTLSTFVLGGRSVNQVQIGHIQDLKPLINLRGRIHVKLDRSYSYDATNVEGGYLINKSHIKALKIGGKNTSDYTIHKTGNYIPERLLEGLEPHRHVRCIEINEYEGVNLPRWVATMGTSFPWLVAVCLWWFCKVQHLPSLSKLENLKYLSLIDMPEVEYMEGTVASAPFFPALEILKLQAFAKLKGWWMESGGQLMIPLFPRLHTLSIEDCPSITSFPIGPHLKNVYLHNLNGELTFHRGKYEANPYISNDNSGDVYDIDDAGLLNSLLGKSLPVTNLKIWEKWFTVESLSGEGIVHLTDLRVLEIGYCDNIELSEDGDDMPWKALDNLTCLSLLALPEIVSLPKGIQYLTTLQVFTIHECYNLELGADREEVLWKGLCNLTTLYFERLSKLVYLPKGIQYLTSLQSLVIFGCENLEALPEWLDCFASLQSLSITDCSKLKLLPEAVARLPSLKTLNIHGCHLAVERCIEPDGEDWPKICHIPNLQL